LLFIKELIGPQNHSIKERILDRMKECGRQIDLGQVVVRVIVDLVQDGGTVAEAVNLAA
jgi:hypothetical protein